MPVYRGSCHCGAILFEIDAVIDKVTECNCSICHKKGMLHHRIAPQQFRWLSDESTLGTYQFGTRTAKHHFCTVCGVHTFSRPRAAPDMFTINVRVLENFDVKTAQPHIIYFDGQHWEASVQMLQQSLEQK